MGTPSNWEFFGAQPLYLLVPEIRGQVSKKVFAEIIRRLHRSTQII